MKIEQTSIAPNQPVFHPDVKYKYTHFDGEEFFCTPLREPQWDGEKWTVLCSVSGRIKGDYQVECDLIEEA